MWNIYLITSVITNPQCKNYAYIFNLVIQSPNVNFNNSLSIFLFSLLLHYITLDSVLNRVVLINIVSDFGTCLVCLIASKFPLTLTWADIQTKSTCVHSAWMLCINVNISHRRTCLLLEWPFCDCLTSVERESMFHFKLQMLLLFCLFLVRLDSMSPASLGIYSFFKFTQYW